MFGYIKPFMPDLRMSEYETYKAVYCGLCHELGKSFGCMARLSLSYDFTFVCLLCEVEAPIITRRCCVNPLKRIKALAPCEAQKFSADIAAIMIYHKILDNIRDGAFYKKAAWVALLPFAKRACEKAAASRPEAAGIIGSCMEKQIIIEASGDGGIDGAAEQSAFAMSGVLALIGRDAAEKRVFERLGYLVGRYVYICDALDDFDRDIKSGGYNPLVLKHRETLKRDEILSGAVKSLYMTVGEIIKTAALLEDRRFGGIIRNITELGLRAGVDEIMNKKNSN